VSKLFVFVRNTYACSRNFVPDDILVDYDPFVMYRFIPILIHCGVFTNIYYFYVLECTIGFIQNNALVLGSTVGFIWFCYR
jgi:hypothetical protein